MRRWLLFATLVLAAIIPPANAASGVTVVVIDGRGFGHGVGMAQDGAFWMAAAGASTDQILGHFYRGVSLSRQAGYVRVPVLATGSSATVSFPQGGDVRDAESGDQSPGFPVELAPGGAVRVSFDGATYRVEVLGGGAPGRSFNGMRDPVLPTTTTSSTTPPEPGDPGDPGATTTTPPDGGGATTTSPTPETTTDTTTPPPAPAAATTTRTPLAVPSAGGTVRVDARNRSYRGFVHVTGVSGGLRLVNQLDVEQYLRGMGEVRDPTWPAAALRAQAVVARTYALRAMALGGEICETQRCQVYLGAQAEYPAMDKAVAQTQGQVLTYKGALVTAVYSSNGGGHSAAADEGFGPGAAGHPYLQPVPYTTQDPGPWQVRVGLADLGRRLGVGDATSAEVSRVGPSGRALELTLRGPGTSRAVSGVSVAKALGLRSTLFSVRIEEAAAPPPPPPEAGVVLQELPGTANAADPVPSAAADTGESAAGANGLQRLTANRASRSDRAAGAAALDATPVARQTSSRTLPFVVLLLALTALALSHRRWMSRGGRHRG
jgi:SpoIID/LytB domain protein